MYTIIKAVNSIDKQVVSSFIKVKVNKDYITFWLGLLRVYGENIKGDGHIWMQ